MEAFIRVPKQRFRGQPNVYSKCSRIDKKLASTRLANRCCIVKMCQRQKVDRRDTCHRQGQQATMRIAELENSSMTIIQAQWIGEQALLSKEDFERLLALARIRLKGNV